MFLCEFFNYHLFKKCLFDISLFQLKPNFRPQAVVGTVPRCDGWRDSDACPHGYRSFSLLHLFRYYILICILMMIFLGLMLKV